MRKRTFTREMKNVRLMDLNHKINRKAMLTSVAQSYYSKANEKHYENWMLEDECIRKGNAYQEAFAQTLATPVGGYVDRYVM